MGNWKASHLLGSVTQLTECVPLCCFCHRVSIVRELHVYGSAVAVHARDTGKLQHQGYGSLLMAAAERIALQVSDRQLVSNSWMHTSALAPALAA